MGSSRSRAPLTVVSAVVRKKVEYENVDNDIVRGEDGHHADEEESETKRSPVNATAAVTNGR